MSYTKDEILEIVRNAEEEIPQRTRYYGTYFGLVEDNQDPLKLGRLRIRTPVHHDPETVSTQNLPWAHYVSPHGGDNDIGFYFVPPVGSQVAVGFVDGDPRYPVWYGTVWGAPEGVSETRVSRINVNDPYGLQAGRAAGWDFTKYNSLTTTSGHKLVFDDNFEVIAPGGIFERRVNYRRISLETRGDVSIVYSNLQGSVVLGDIVQGETSLAKGEVARVDTQAGEIHITSTQGEFRVGETVSSEGGSGSFTVSSFTDLEGFFFRMRLDKSLTEKYSGRRFGQFENFRGIMEMGTPDGRKITLDDSDPQGALGMERGTIKIEAPDGHYFEINSATNYIESKTEVGHFLRFDDVEEFIDLSTFGDDPQEFGFRFRLDEKEEQAYLKGDRDDYFMLLDELGTASSIGMYRNMTRSGAGAGGIGRVTATGATAGVEVGDWVYSSLPDRGTVTIFAGGDIEENGLFVDYGASSFSRPKAIYFYDKTSRQTPNNHIRLVTDTNGAPGVVDGQIDIGNTSGGTRISMNPNSDAQFFANDILTLWGNSEVKIRGGLSSDSVEIEGPTVSKYFKHRHQINLSGAAGAPNRGITFDLTGTFPLPGAGTATGLQLSGIPSGLWKTEPPNTSIE